MIWPIIEFKCRAGTHVNPQRYAMTSAKSAAPASACRTFLNATPDEKMTA